MTHGLARRTPMQGDLRELIEERRRAMAAAHGGAGLGRALGNADLPMAGAAQPADSSNFLS
jgi:hypothetical protein